MIGTFRDDHQGPQRITGLGLMRGIGPSRGQRIGQGKEGSVFTSPLVKFSRL